MKKLFYILTLNCLLLIPSTRDCYSQPSMTWSKTYGKPLTYDASYSVSNTGSGYYYVGGYEDLRGGNLIKINENGDSAWSEYYSRFGFINAIISLPDRGCIIAGDSDSLTVIRLDSNGIVLWSKNYMQSFNFTRIKDIERTFDGRFIACGYRDHELDGILVKFYENGNLDWVKIYPAGYVKTFQSIEITPDNGYLMTGEVIDYDTLKTLLLRLDSSGNMIWEKQYKISNQPAYGGYIKKINSGYFIAGGTYDSLNNSENREYFIRIDTAGNLKYSKVIPFFKFDEFYAAQYLDEDKYIFSSFTYEQGNHDTDSYSKVIITDSSGNILVSRNFYGTYYYGFNAITKANNSDIILAGSAKTPGSGEDILVCRVDILLQGPPIGLKKIEKLIPLKLNLYQNFPNPFNSSTKIKFDLPKDGFVTFKIYDVLGKELISKTEYKTAGSYQITLDGTNYASGLYFYRLESGSFVQTKKMVLVK